MIPGYKLTTPGVQGKSKLNLSRYLYLCLWCFFFADLFPKNCDLPTIGFGLLIFLSSFLDNTEFLRVALALLMQLCEIPSQFPLSICFNVSSDRQPAHSASKPYLYMYTRCQPLSCCTIQFSHTFALLSLLDCFPGITLFYRKKVNCDGI